MSRYITESERSRRFAWDVRFARRAAALAAVAAAIVLLVVVTTDESAPWSRRLAMWGAIVPACGTIGVLAALAIAETRGELRALHALGVSRARAALGAMMGGAIIALAGAALATTGRADLGALFPRPIAARAWQVESATSVREPALGVRVSPGGALALVPRTESPGESLPPRASLAALLALALAAFAGPLWAAAPSRRFRKIVAAGVALAAMIVAFQAVGARRLPTFALALGPLVLAADGAVAWWRAMRIDGGARTGSAR